MRHPGVPQNRKTGLLAIMMNSEVVVVVFGPSLMNLGKTDPCIRLPMAFRSFPFPHLPRLVVVR